MNQINILIFMEKACIKFIYFFFNLFIYLFILKKSQIFIRTDV